MFTLRITADIKDDRKVVLTLPADVPTGQAELVVIVAPQMKEKPKRPGTKLADWAEANAEDWGDRLSSEDVEGFTGRRY